MGGHPTVPPSAIPKIVDLALIRPPLLLGPPGIGKTWNVVSAACGAAARSGTVLVDLSGDTRLVPACREVKRIVPSTPSELVKTYDKVAENPDNYFVYLRMVGTQITKDDITFPRIYRNTIVNVPPIKLAFLSIPRIRGLLFLDEITAIQDDDLRATLFGLINEKTVGLAGGLSDEVAIVAAGNTEEENPLAMPMEAALISRFQVYYVRPPTAQEFIDFYINNCAGCSSLVPAYLTARPGDVYRAPGSARTWENFPTPRTWFTLGKILARDIPLELKEAAAIGLLGPQVGGMFVAWLRLQPPEPQELLSNPHIYTQLDKNETKYLAAVTTVEYIAEKAIAEGEEFLARYGQAIHKLFSVISSESMEIYITSVKLMARKLVDGKAPIHVQDKLFMLLPHRLKLFKVIHMANLGA